MEIPYPKDAVFHYGYNSINTAAQRRGALLAAGSARDGSSSGRSIQQRLDMSLEEDLPKNIITRKLQRRRKRCEGGQKLEITFSQSLGVPLVSQHLEWDDH